MLPGNRVVHPYEFGVLKVPWIREFQVTQESLNSIVMRVIPFHTPSTQEMAALVPEIPIDGNGKFRVYRSPIRSAYDGYEWPDQTEKPPCVSEFMSESHWGPDVDKKNTR